jgi:hypothetical protein
MTILATSEQRHRSLSDVCQAQMNGTFTTEMWHPVSLCTGNCAMHPLLQHDYDKFMNYSWGNWNEELFAADRARETAAETAKRIAAEAARDAAAAVEAEAIRQHLYATELAFKQSIGQKKLPKGAEKPAQKLIEQPCKWLYAVPGKDGVFSHKPCAECWGHEYTDAKGIKLAPHKCQYIHPNQPGWKAEWNALMMTRDRWRAPKVEGRFDGLAAPRSKKPSGPSGW